jgi:hypothetical protein
LVLSAAAGLLPEKICPRRLTEHDVAVK